MSSAYTINFSDTSKPTITVPAMPPGINAVDTSLNLVGRGYPDYGRKIAENFLHLLENFASPFPGPRQPIEGQLWYDTSNPYNKVLRVRDGSSWANANGIYQQGDDPRTSSIQPATLRAGDIWVDTTNLQLKIYSSGNWTTVGPMSSGVEKNGIETEIIEDNTVSRLKHSVIKVWIAGDVIAVITDNKFTPRIGIPGFSVLLPGINLRSTAIGILNLVPMLNGVSANSKGLEVNGIQYSSDKFLRKDDTAFRSQVISGNVFFKTPTDGLGQGQYGIVINNQSSASDPKYIQFYKSSNDAFILNNDPNGSIVFKVNDGTTLVSAVDVNSDSVRITVPVVISGNSPLTVGTGTVTFGGTLSVGATATIGNNLSVNRSLSVASSATISGILYVNNRDILGSVIPGTAIEPSVAGQYDIGSPTKYFRTLYVDQIGTVGTSTTVYGNVVGSATSLENSTQFKLSGQISAPDILFNGTNTATFVASLTADAISSQTEITTATSDVSLLVLNTSTNELAKITYPNLSKSFFTTGMIMPFASNVNIPLGWELCDGRSLFEDAYLELFAVIGNSYDVLSTAGEFSLPTLNTVDTYGNPVYYIIKT
jgi:hypothetical protein